MEITMDDMERYGDYNEIDEPPQKSKVLTAIKIVAMVLVFSVVGLLAFRLIIFNYYPSNMKKIYYNDILTAYYDEQDGDIGAKTQTLKAPYDDEKDANFMCDHLIFIPGANQLQISLRLNRNLYDDLSEELSLPVDTELDSGIFSFRLSKLDFSANGSNSLVETASVTEWKTFVMYDYCKIVFDGVDFTDGGAGYWMVLEIFVEGQKEEAPYSKVMILDATEEFYSIKDYDLSGGEKP